MADLKGAAFQAQTSSDLLRCPARHQPVDDKVTKVSVPDQLAQTGAASLGFGLGVESIISRQVLQLGVDEAIALQFSVDRGTVAAEAGRDLQDRHFGVMPARDFPAVFQTEIGRASPDATLV